MRKGFPKIRLRFLYFLAFGLLVSVFSPSTPTLASSSMDSVTEGLNVTSNAGGFGSEAPDIFNLAGKSISLIIALLGIVILGLIIYSGSLYLISQGDKTKVEKAQKILTYTIGGAVLILAAYAIANFVLGGLNAIFPS